MSAKGLNMNIQLKEGLLIQKVVDEVVVLEPISGDYYTLNEVGALMIESMQSGMSVAETTTKICSLFDVSREQVEGDLNFLLKELEQSGLAHKVDV